MAAAVYNANPFRGKDARVVSPADFLPDEPGANNEPTEEEKLEQFKAFFDGMKKAQEKKQQILPANP